MKNLNNFTGQYPISKTLRFELKPQGKTLEHIEKSGILENDNYRAEKYEEVKDIIDSYHKWFINETLHDLHINWTELKDALENNRREKCDASKKELQRVQKIKREEIYKAFNEHEAFQYLFKENLLSELLPIQIEHSEDLDAEKKKHAIETFYRFSTYFTGFHENRKNIYSKEEISTSVTYRIVHDNFPKFLENIKVFEILNQECPEVLISSANELISFMEGVQIQDVFSPDFFNSTFTQNGIDYYNRILGGVTTEKGEKYRGINEFTNLYRQQHPEFGKSKNATKMVVLFKQILSDRDTLSFIPEMFANDKQVQESIQLFYNREISQFENEGVKTDVCTALGALISKISEFDTDKIYIQQPELTNVSQRLFGSWGELNACLFKYAEFKFGTAERVVNRKKIDKWLKLDLFSFNELNKALEFSGKDERIENYFSEIGTFAQLVKTGFDEAQSILKTEYSSDVHLKDQQADVEKIKAFLDALQNMMHLLKSLYVSEEADRDTAFYNEFDTLYNQLKLVVPLYNKVRNYITQKLNDEGKIKLNFENPTLADGWDLNKEKDNTTIILIKDGNYFLAVMNAKNKPKFSEAKAVSGESCYQKMVYKLLPGPNKMLPKVFFSKKGIDSFNPPNSILAGYKADKHKKGSAFDLAFCHQLIDYFKLAISQHPDWKNFGFQFSDTKSYEDISAFYKEISQQGYKITFVDISERQINEWIDEGKLYLFQIYNKDFAAGATGSPNLHTMYWKSLFSPENLQSVVFKLNGEAELFYRKSNIKKPASHKVGEKMVNRRDKTGNPIPDSVYKELFLHFNRRNREPLSELANSYLDTVTVKDVTHEIIKDRRYSESKFLFHVPLTINFKADARNEYMNEGVQTFLTNNPDINIIGLDRGERHLIYLTLINQKGEILKQKTFNIVGNTNYQEKLNQREKERDTARKSWATIGKIKELKEGFLSLVIHEIADIMVKNNAIVVLEDLNFGFKRGRFKVEKQIYQKFEKMLIDKLNYLVFKDRKATEPGGVLNGYQLAEKFESFQKMGKQSGFLFYVPAAYTSKIDPTTGFVNMLNLNYTNMKDAQTLLSGLDKISFNADANYFEFELDYEKFKTNQTDHTNKWTICTVGEKRFTYNSATKETRTVNVTGDFKKLLDKSGIGYANGHDLKDAICGQTDAKFFETILWLLKLTMQMRNSNAKTEEDFILSPVKNSSGGFFRSNDDTTGIWPADADANGAYHIALKGLYLLKEVFGNDKKEMKIEHAEWFRFAQTRFNVSETKNG